MKASQLSPAAYDKLKQASSLFAAKDPRAMGIVHRAYRKMVELEERVDKARHAQDEEERHHHGFLCFLLTGGDFMTINSTKQVLPFYVFGSASQHLMQLTKTHSNEFWTFSFLPSFAGNGCGRYPTFTCLFAELPSWKAGAGIQ